MIFIYHIYDKKTIDNSFENKTFRLLEWLQKHSKWVIFKADEKKEKVLLESEGGLESTFDDFRDALPNNEPRWAAYDLKVEKADWWFAYKINFI